MKDVNLKLLEKVKVDKIASVNIKLDYVKFWKNFKECRQFYFIKKFTSKFMCQYIVFHLIFDRRTRVALSERHLYAD